MPNMAQSVMKTRLKGAQKGRSLLKKKADALNLRFQELLKKIVDNKQHMADALKEAAFSLAEAKFTAGDFSQLIVEKVSFQAQYTVSITRENVVGVFLPVFEAHRKEGPDAYNLVGLGKGGANITKLKRNFNRAVELLVELATLQTCFVTLDEAIKVTNRRVNAIEHVIIPKLEDMQICMLMEQDEMEREDFFRMKKIKANKKQDKELVAATADGVTVERQPDHGRVA